MWLEYRFTTPGFSCGTIPAPALYGVFGRHSRRNQLGMSVETDKGIGWLLDKSKSATLKGRFSRRRCISDASRGVEAKLSRGRGTFARVRRVGVSFSSPTCFLLSRLMHARILAYVWIMIGVCHCRTFDSNARFMSDLIRLPADYRQLLESLKGRIRAAQLRAGVAVNRELVLLYLHWPGNPRSSVTAKVGRQDHRPLVEGLKTIIPRNARVLAAEPEIHALIR